MEALRQRGHVVPTTIDRTECAAQLALAEAQLGAEAYAGAFAEGWALSQDALSELLLGWLGEGQAAEPGDQNTGATK